MALADMHGAGVACSRRTFVQGSSSPRNGRHPHSRCNWPKLVTRAPCCLNAIFPFCRSLASAWFPRIALMYFITTSWPVEHRRRCRTTSPAHASLDGRRSLNIHGCHALVEAQSAVKPSSSRPSFPSFGRASLATLRGQSRADRPLALHDSRNSRFRRQDLLLRPWKGRSFRSTTDE